MKLKRKHAIVVWGLCASAVVFCITAFLCAAIKEVGFWFKLAAVISVVSIVLAFYLRLRWFLCPHCGEGIAPPQLRAGKRYYCVRCGKPFIYDDEPDKPLD